MGVFSSSQTLPKPSRAQQATGKYSWSLLSRIMLAEVTVSHCSESYSYDIGHIPSGMTGHR